MIASGRREHPSTNNNIDDRSNHLLLPIFRAVNKHQLGRIQHYLLCLHHRKTMNNFPRKRQWVRNHVVSLLSHVNKSTICSISTWRWWVTTFGMRKTSSWEGFSTSCLFCQSDLRHLNGLNHRLRGHRRNQLHWTLVIRPPWTKAPRRASAHDARSHYVGSGTTNNSIIGHTNTTITSRAQLLGLLVLSQVHCALTYYMILLVSAHLLWNYV